MKLTSKGRIAVTSLVDIDINSQGGKPVSLSEISLRQNISLSFLEQIFLSLKKNGIVFLTVPAYNFLWTSKDEDLKHFRRYNKDTLLQVTPKNFSILKISYFNTLLFPILSLILLFLRFFRIRFINQAETQPLSIINFFLYKIFSFEKYFIKSINFPFGLSLMAILRKSK